MPTQNWRSALREGKPLHDSKRQVVCRSAEPEMPGDRVTLSRDEQCLIIGPLPRRRSLPGVLATLEPPGSEDEFPDIDEGLQPLKAIDI